MERAGQVLMVQVPDRVSDPRGPGTVGTGNRGSGQLLMVDVVPDLPVAVAAATATL